MIRQKRFSMNFRRGKRDVPGLNTTSTADISFILLVFFLVISSMDSTKGVFKQLPPEDKAKTEEVTEMPLCFSISIQSDTACLLLFLAFTEPAR